MTGQQQVSLFFPLLPCSSKHQTHNSHQPLECFPGGKDHTKCDLQGGGEAGLTSEIKEKYRSHLCPSPDHQNKGFPACGYSAEPSSSRGQLVKGMRCACLAQDEAATNLMLITMVVISFLTRCNPFQPSPMA